METTAIIDSINRALQLDPLSKTNDSVYSEEFVSILQKTSCLPKVAQSRLMRKSMSFGQMLKGMDDR